MSELVRVLRLYEFVGDRAAVEEQVNNSVHGNRVARTEEGRRLAIIGTTIGTFPEILRGAEAVRVHSWFEDEDARTKRIQDGAIQNAIVFLESGHVGDASDASEEEVSAAGFAAKLLRARFDVK